MTVLARSRGAAGAVLPGAPAAASATARCLAVEVATPPTPAAGLATAGH